jgi:hypothetical protein
MFLFIFSRQVDFLWTSLGACCGIEPPPSHRKTTTPAWVNATTIRQYRDEQMHFATQKSHFAFISVIEL